MDDPTNNGGNATVDPNATPAAPAADDQSGGATGGGDADQWKPEGTNEPTGVPVDNQPAEPMTGEGEQAPEVPRTETPAADVTNPAPENPEKPENPTA